MEDNKLKIIGITGGVGAGKSTVAKLYADIKGAYIIFTDNVAKYLQEEGKTCYNLIVEHFGQEILNDDRSINRAKLAQIVFGNEEELKIQEMEQTLRLAKVVDDDGVSMLSTGDWVSTADPKPTSQEKNNETKEEYKTMSYTSKEILKVVIVIISSSILVGYFYILFIKK